MRAYRYTGHAVLPAEVPDPDLLAGEVLVRPHYTGICGTDLHISHGLHPRVRPPVTLGHEFSGTIAASDDPGWPVDSPVAVEPLRSCGQCRVCRAGRYNQCPRLQILGVDCDGSLADLVRVPVQRLIPLQGVSMRLGALTEPLAVAVHAVTRLGELPPDRPVLIFGGGPIGWLAAAALAAQGTAAHVVEHNDFRRELLTAAGHRLVDLDNLADRDTENADYAGAIEASGTRLGWQTLIEHTGCGGVISVVGLPQSSADTAVMSIISRELRISGSRVYTQTDFLRARDLLAATPGAFEPLITHEIPADALVRDGLARIEAGDPVGKILVRGVPR